MPSRLQPKGCELPSLAVTLTRGRLPISHRHRASIAAGWSRELFRALAAQETMVATRTLDYSVGQEWRSGGGTETVTGAGTGERVRGGGVKGTSGSGATTYSHPVTTPGQPGLRIQPSDK